MTHLNQPFFNFTVAPRKASVPVKIDSILEERIKTFQRARRVRRFTFTREP
jgi:hypothetical protein